MAKYCSKCGKQLSLTANYCENCGKRSKPMDKSKLKLLIMLSIVVIVIVVGTVLFFILRDDAGRFIGTWQVESSMESSSSDMQWTFFSNGSIKMTTSYYYEETPDIGFTQNIVYYDPVVGNMSLTVQNVEQNSDSSIQWGTFKIEDGKLHISSTVLGGSESSLSYPFEYDFSSDDHVTLTLGGYTLILTLTRLSEDEINQSQPLDNVLWENVNISIDGPDVIHWDSITLSRSSVSYSRSSAPSEWGNVTVGDVIEFGGYDTNYTVIFRWLPTNGLIDTYNFYAYS